MFIYNKKKFFNKIYFEVFKKSMLSLNDMNVTLTHYGAKPYIENNKERFVLSTYLFNLFFIEGALQSKYYPEYKTEISMIIDSMLSEISNRLSIDGGQALNAYMTVRNALSNESLDSDAARKIHPFYTSAVMYLFFTFKEEYKPEDLGYDIGAAEESVAKIFQSLINSVLIYLNAL